MIIFFLLTHPLISTLSFSFPSSMSLNNGDILIVHKNGVTVTDSNCNQIKKEPVKFDPDYELIAEDKLSTISLSKFTDGYIVGIINKRIYFFTPTGDFNKKNNGEITSSPILYFSLVPSTSGISSSAPKVACVNVIGISHSTWSPFLV